MARPDPEMLHKILRYEPDSGLLFWRERPADMFANPRSAKGWNTRFHGKEALAAGDGNGYRTGDIFGEPIRAHIVIWALQTGRWPTSFIDHANCERSDNRWSNLRLANRTENNCNTRLRSDNTSGFKGVSRVPGKKPWCAKVRAYKKTRYLGLFNCSTAAALACAKVRFELHGEFGRGG